MIEFCAFFDSLLSCSKNHRNKSMSYIIDDVIDGRSHQALELTKIASKQGLLIPFYGEVCLVHVVALGTT